MLFFFCCPSQKTPIRVHVILVETRQVYISNDNTILLLETAYMMIRKFVDNVHWDLLVNIDVVTYEMRACRW